MEKIEFDTSKNSELYYISIQNNIINTQCDTDIIDNYINPQ